MSEKLFSEYIYYAISAVFTLGILFGIFLMSKAKTASLGNRISALCILLAIVLTLLYNNIFPIWVLYVALAIGAVIGTIFSIRVKMIQMPQMVALLNGLGGAASAIVGVFAMLGVGAGLDAFSQTTSALAVSIGAITLFGSLIAAGKLHRVLPQKPIVLKNHQIYTTASLLLIVLSIVLFAVGIVPQNLAWILIVINLLLSVAFGVLFSIRVGGADMPITISLLNSLSGVAGAIAGLALGDILLVAVGGIVGASGLLLTQIMCKAINRHLFDILLGKTSKSSKDEKTKSVDTQKEKAQDTDSAVVLQEQTDDIAQASDEEEELEKVYPLQILKEAKNVIIVTGYGMAVAQAQHLVKNLADKLKDFGAEVKYAIHPVAGRMPGHMNVLLCEADVDYEDLYEMDDIDSEFSSADAAIVVGANDVLNPAAREAVDTPIYGMPVLSVDACKNIYIFNYDDKPGYAGVENPLYQRKKGVYLFFGNAADTLKSFLNDLG